MTKQEQLIEKQRDLLEYILCWMDKRTNGYKVVMERISEILALESEIKEKDEPKMSAEEFAREHIINGWGTYEGIPLIRLSRFYEYVEQFKQ
jgi:hypothetical protein